MLTKKKADWKTSWNKMKDFPTACLAPSFATVVMDKQVISCDKVGAASVAQVSKSTQREGVSHLLQSQPAACSREEPPWQQPPPLCSHTVLMLYWGCQHTGPLYLHVARALKHATLLCVQMNKQNSTSSKSLSVKQNIFAEGKSPRTELGALWASTLAFDKLIYRPKYLCLLTWIFFFLWARALLCC